MPRPAAEVREGRTIYTRLRESEYEAVLMIKARTNRTLIDILRDAVIFYVQEKYPDVWRAVSGDKL